MGNKELDLFRSLYIKGRKILTKDLQGLSTEALDWRGLNPDSVITIGSNIIHIVGFNHLVRMALQGQDLQELTRNTEWLSHFSSGFPRELATSPPNGKPLSFYLKLMDQENKATLDFLDNAAFDMHGETLFYKDGKEFQEDALIPHNSLELLFYMATHSRYHHGQITQQKYNFNTIRKGTDIEVQT